VHTLKGSARGVGANTLGDVCQRCEAVGPGALPAVHAALDEALTDIAAYAHERALKSLKSASRNSESPKSTGGRSGRAG
jgi:chemotaxis protein histidine kinase CheA